MAKCWTYNVSSHTWTGFRPGAYLVSLMFSQHSYNCLKNYTCWFVVAFESLLFMYGCVQVMTFRVIVRSFPGFLICYVANSPGSLCSQLSPLTFFGYQKIGGPIWSGGGVFTVEHVSMWVAIAFSAIVSRSRCSID